MHINMVLYLFFFYLYIPIHIHPIDPRGASSRAAATPRKPRALDCAGDSTEPGPPGRPVHGASYDGQIKRRPNHTKIQHHTVHRKKHLPKPILPCRPPPRQRARALRVHVPPFLLRQRHVGFVRGQPQELGHHLVGHLRRLGEQALAVEDKNILAVEVQEEGPEVLLFILYGRLVACQRADVNLRGGGMV